MIQGGKEEPCLPLHYPEMNEAETGFPCPRREWPGAEDPHIYELVMLGKIPEQAHLFRELFAATFGDETGGERRRVLLRVLRAYGDEAIRGVLWPKQE